MAFIVNNLVNILRRLLGKISDQPSFVKRYSTSLLVETNDQCFSLADYLSTAGLQMIFFVLYRNFPHQNCLTERVCYNFRQNASKVRKLFFFVTSYFFISHQCLVNKTISCLQDNILSTRQYLVYKTFSWLKDNVLSTGQCLVYKILSCLQDNA